MDGRCSPFCAAVAFQKVRLEKPLPLFLLIGFNQYSVKVLHKHLTVVYPLAAVNVQSSPSGLWAVGNGQ